MTGTGRDHTFQEIRPVQSLHAPAFEFTEVSGHGDFAEHDRRLEELAREAAASAASETALVLAPPVAALLEMSLDLGSDDEDLLEDARANAAAQEYDLALELLDEYLGAHPEHQEGRYLRAYCLYHLDGQGQLEALRILRPLRETPPADEGLRDRIRDLRRELRRRLTPPEITAYTQSVRTDPRGALARVEAFLELAPEEGTLSYLLALGQARDGDLERALDTAERGAAQADVDGEQVAALARRLRLALLAPHAAPAVSAFKTGDLDRARRELARMDLRWRRSVVVDDFDAYLALLLGRADGRAAPPAPRLPADRTEDLYSLIADADGQRAADLMRAGHAEQAERLLAHVLALVPGFPWLNFLYAACLYRLLRDPDRAAACAEIALRDPTLTQARQLLETIKSWQEASLVNPVVDAYVAAMESVRGGVSVERLAALRLRLVDLERIIPTLSAAVHSEEGAQIVRDLGQAIGQRLVEIADAMTVGGLYEKYDRLMSTVKGGISSAHDADRLGQALDGIAAEIKSVRKAAGKGTGDQLDELAALVSSRRAEVEKVKAGIEVSALVRRFNELAEQQSESLARLRADPYTVRSRLSGILEDARRLRRGAKRTLDTRDQTLLDELIATISRTLR
uniref:Tetratricopeptide repeat protein n=1 Tax=Streptomyces sp. NBC_00003 TaxID=2903608 RepID=A0AAU2VFG7_9ACTN